VRKGLQRDDLEGNSGNALILRPENMYWYHTKIIEIGTYVWSSYYNENK